MQPLPPELSAIAQQVDEAENQVYSQASPRGEFTLVGLNTLVAALNEVLPFFSVESYPDFAEDVESLPVDFLKLLTMVFKAAADSGAMPAEDLGKVKSDKDLTMLAGKVSALAKDRDFQAFLRSPPKPKAAPKEEMSPKMEEEMGEEDIDSLLSSRM